MIEPLSTQRAQTTRNILLAAALMSSVSLAAQAQPANLEHCAELAVKGGLPANLTDAMYLMEWNSPAYVVGMACQAASQTVKFRYLPGGLIRKESLQLKGKSTLRIWVKRQTLEAEQVELLIPVEYELNGRSFEVTRNNLQVLAMILRNVLNNE